jgi:hypothetical protein
MLREMFLLLFGSIPIFAALNPFGFSMTCLGAVALAALLWWLCSLYTRLWNLSFYLNWFHLLLCGLAAVWTIFFVIAFLSVGEIGHAFDRVVDEWGAQLHSLSASVDTQLSSLNADDLRSQFEATHPFLRDVVRSAQTASSEVTDTPGANSADSDSPDKSGGETIDQTVNDLKYLLQFHVHWAVFRLRAFLVLSFLLAQGFVFALTGYGAHRDIRPRN